MVNMSKDQFIALVKGRIYRRFAFIKDQEFENFLNGEPFTIDLTPFSKDDEKRFLIMNILEETQESLTMLEDAEILNKETFKFAAFPTESMKVQVEISTKNI